MNTKRLAVITVTHHPDANRLAQQLGSLPSDSQLVLVDNASDATEVAAIGDLANGFKRACVLKNTHNVGLAAAVNQGAKHASSVDPECEFLLFMDQDSIPRSGAVEQLLQAFVDLEAKGQRVGSVGPRLIDESTGLQHGFHCVRGLFLYRDFPAENEVTPISLINLNGGGTLVRTTLFKQLGGLEEDFFIDHIDTEWSFDVLHAGYGLFGIPQARFDHCMGERGIAYWWLGWRVWPRRSPQRHYYLFRNTIRLIRRRYVPRVWKVWVLAKLALTVVVHGVFDPQRSTQIHNMFKGLKEGMFARNPTQAERAD